MTEDLAHPSAITRHPSASVYDHFFAVSLPEVPIVAARKNVFLQDGEAEAVLHYALKGIPRKTLKLALQNNNKACWATSFALDHALDVLAMMRLISLSESVCKKPLLGEGPLVEKAEECLKQHFANDKAPTRAVWRDPVEDATNFIRGAFTGPNVRLPETAAVRATVQKAGVNPLDAAAMIKLNATFNPDAGNFARLGGGNKDALSGSSARFDGLNGPVGLTASEKSTRDYAIREGVMWAADNREILKLGTGAIDIIKQTQLRKDVYDGLTKDAHLSSPGALGIAKAIHDKGGDANAGGQAVTKNLKEIGDSDYTAAVDRFGKTHFKKDATQAEKDAASEDVRNVGERAAHRHPAKANTIKRNNEIIGAAKKDELVTKATNDAKATANKDLATKQTTKSKLLATLD